MGDAEGTWLRWKGSAGGLMGRLISFSAGLAGGFGCYTPWRVAFLLAKRRVTQGPSLLKFVLHQHTPRIGTLADPTSPLENAERGLKARALRDVVVARDHQVEDELEQVAYHVQLLLMQLVAPPEPDVADLLDVPL